MFASLSSSALTPSGHASLQRLASRPSPVPSAGGRGLFPERERFLPWTTVTRCLRRSPHLVRINSQCAAQNLRHQRRRKPSPLHASLPAEISSSRAAHRLYARLNEEDVQATPASSSPRREADPTDGRTLERTQEHDAGARGAKEEEYEWFQGWDDSYQLMCVLHVCVRGITNHGSSISHAFVASPMQTLSPMKAIVKHSVICQRLRAPRPLVQVRREKFSSLSLSLSLCSLDGPVHARSRASGTTSTPRRSRANGSPRRPRSSPMIQTIWTQIPARATKGTNRPIQM